MKPRSRRLWIFGGLALLFLLICGGLPTWAIHQFGWDWTGFNGGYGQITIHEASQDKVLPPAKTLWDWLQLLVVPIMLAGGAAFFTWWNTRIERQIAQRRFEQDREITEQRYKQDQAIAEQRYKQDQELALDKQREDLLQSYLDRMAELLLEKGLRNSEPDAEVRKVARTRTISTLIQLDGKRASTIFVFLNEAQLTKESDPIISFKNADLSNAKWSKSIFNVFNLHDAWLIKADLSYAGLIRANLSRAMLTQANLSGTLLSNANLSGADLAWANLGKADLSKADLSKADLSKANLSKADLSWANLSMANLSMANLRGTNLSWADLSKADLNETDFSGANLNGANLSMAKGLTPGQFAGCKVSEIRGLTPEQLACCKASEVIIDECTPATPLKQDNITNPLPSQGLP